jgi:antirestriction protein ArdC
MPDHFHARASARLDPVQRIAKADEFFAAARADLRHGGNRAFYSPSTDHVQMPHIETFRDAESYYATLAHEFTHWTKHKTRLDRDFGRKNGAMKATPSRNWSRSWALPFCARTWTVPPSRGRTMPLTSQTGSKS